MKIAGTTSTAFVTRQPARRVELSSPMPQAIGNASPSKPLAPAAAAAPSFVSSRPAHAPVTYSAQAARPIATASDYKVSPTPFAAAHEARMAYGISGRSKLPS
jgi:hypothetical protein